MAWARLDDKRAMHRKFRRRGFAARGLDEAAICWSAHEETDGFISDEALEDLAHHHGVSVKAAMALATTLVDPIGRWRRDEAKGGWWIKDYLDFNPSHRDLEAARKRDRDRKRERAAAKTDSTRTPDGSDQEA